ncbi:M28 family peptidase [Paracidobacterium acidisoli]|uniref:Peptidase M28 domain-containing protein n=1 Tax=Paracidobacterium acidisoli TaxID=2303751 RepID=A0A372IPA7_9BACT|nr:M28 family peptidase [Paracidobacterium acidisoli]MBT9331006.1 M28 family peptidase [Paracidobacterium acidisoli]
MFPLFRALTLLFATASPGAAQHGLIYFSVPRSELEGQVHAVPQTDAARFTHLQESFITLGCRGGHMEEQIVHGRHQAKGKNLICTLPGTTPDTIVIAAHYQLEGHGQSVVDDWSGAMLLPFLFEALQAQQRDHTFVFVEAWNSQGASAWMHSRTKQQQRSIQSMIDLNALGLGDTSYFSPSFISPSPQLATLHLQEVLGLAAEVDGTQKKLPQPVDPTLWLRTDDTESFRSVSIPAILIHSVSINQYRLPGSSQDIPSAIDPNAYYRSYRLLCAFLIELDNFASHLDETESNWLRSARNGSPVHPSASMSPH